MKWKTQLLDRRATPHRLRALAEVTGCTLGHELREQCPWKRPPGSQRSQRAECRPDNPRALLGQSPLWLTTLLHFPFVLPYAELKVSGSFSWINVLLSQSWVHKNWKPGEGNGSPLQYSCLEKSMDRGAWRAAVHGVT